MKSKILLILMSFVLLINIYDLRVFANTEYDHNALLEYEGYGEAMYESIVEQTTFITGKYTDNKEYVQQSVQQVKDYASFWKNEYSNFSDSCYKTTFMNCFGEMTERAGAYALTVGDWIKNLFIDYGEENVPEKEVEVFNFMQYMTASSTHSNTFAVKSGYRLQIYLDGVYKSGMENSYGQNLFSFTGSYSDELKPNNDKLIGKIRATASGVLSPFKDVNGNEAYNYFTFNANKDFSNYATVASDFGLTFTIVNAYDNSKILTPTISKEQDPDFKKIHDHITTVPQQIVVPEPKAYLSCPDGTRIQMSINGGTFLDVNGQVMQVSHDGTATVDSQICNLNWEKPQIKYIDDRVGITTPDGNVIDAETGQILEEKPFDWEKEIDDEIEDGCGVVCIFGKILKGLGEMAKALFAIPESILDGLLDLLKKLFLPSENYWETEMNGLKDKFFNKEIEKNVDAIKGLGNAGGGTFQDVQVSIMGVSNVTVVDSTSINSTLDAIHSWVRGFFYPLLLFFNISMLYRLIRGTSFVGIGRNGEGGGDK